MHTYSVSKDHWLLINDIPVEKVECEVDKFSDGSNICDYIVFHYTAGTSAKSAHNTYKSPVTQVSWHLTIDRDGSVYQLLDFRKRAWHAGTSSWKRPNGDKIIGLNKWAIGIEMISAGPLTKNVDGQYVTWFGEIMSKDAVYEDQLGNYWHDFTEEQKIAAGEVAKVLAKQYKCLDIMGHEHISPGRKIDPGPAFKSTLAKIRKENGFVNPLE